MPWQDSVASWFKKSPWNIIWFVVGFFVFGGLVDLVKHLTELRADVAWVVLAGTQHPADATVKTWFVFALVSLVCLLAIFVLLYVQVRLNSRSQLHTLHKAQSELGNSRSRLTESGNVAQKTLDGMMTAANRIREQLFPPSKKLIHSYVRIHHIYRIHKNFDAEVRSEYEIRASNDRVHFLEIRLQVEPEADEVRYLHDLDFKVSEDGDKSHSLCYLLSRNDTRAKWVVIFFLPCIETNEPKARKFTVSYKWPRMFGRVDLKTQELYTWQLLSADPVSSFKCEVYLQPGANRNLKCEIAGQRGKDAIKPTTDPYQQWPGWVYDVDDADNGRYSLDIRADKP